MKRRATQADTLTVGQLARRWGVGNDRIRRMIQAGILKGSFEIPSVGRYRSAIKIPRSVIERAERDWGIGPRPNSIRPRQRPSRTGPALKHLPELATMLEPDAESPASEKD